LKILKPPVVCQEFPSQVNPVNTLGEELITISDRQEDLLVTGTGTRWAVALHRSTGTYFKNQQKKCDKF
jgi:hypothetical protein